MSALTPRAARLPTFDNSPVVEVVLSAALRPILGLTLVELVQLWEAVFLTEFPAAREQPPFQMPVERFGGPPRQAGLSLQVGQGVPAVRLFASNADGTGVVQLQNNWIARNWKQADPKASYPHYPRIRERFADDLARTSAHLAGKGLGPLHPVQCELTYVNHIANEDGSKPELGQILTVIDEAGASRGLQYESARFAAQFLITSGGNPVGRVYLSADPAIRRTDNAQIVAMNVTARGHLIGEGIEGCLAFLDVAHARAVTTFDRLTRPTMHKRWGRRMNAR